MITSQVLEEVRGWFTGRLPQEWTSSATEEPEGAVEVTLDREEVTVVLAVPDVAVSGSAVEDASARAGRAKAFREETREARMRIASEAEHRFGRKVSWGVQVGAGEAAHRELWTHVAAPVMTRLRQPQRKVLDTLVDAGVARSRADALGWCVRLVGQHEEEWLGELRAAMSQVDEVRGRGPVA